LRSEARDVVAALRARNLPAEILSGDAWVAVAHTAQFCGIEQYTARQSPASKLEYVRELTASGESIAMVGDGINDAPVLKGAAVSIAMGRASALAQVSADIVLIGDSLSALPEAIEIARRTQRIVKQNLAWAAGYNLIALPLAAMGYVPPWLAAVGMSVSSIVVVLNALRLSPTSRRGTRDARRAGRDTGHETRDAQEDIQDTGRDLVVSDLSRHASRVSRLGA
jgi:Cu2+-exporting ATPase